MADDARAHKRQKRGESSKKGEEEAGDAVPAAGPAVSTADNDASTFYLTRLRGVPPAHNLRAKGLGDLLEGDFTRCLLTNYMYDLPWLFGECPRLNNVPVVLVHGERDRHRMVKECGAYANVTAVAPPLPIPYGTHHTKMMVVLYPEKVRVAIFTANFIPADWNKKTQGVWYQDFELKTLAGSSDENEGNTSSSKPSSNAAVHDFEADLVHYLSSLGHQVQDFCAELERFDFSSARVALIPSVPGVHKGKDMEKYGHLRVRRLLKAFKIPETDNPLICQFSSLGSLDEKWLYGEFRESFLPGKKNVSTTSVPVQALHIIWPSVEDVRNSIEGWSAGCSIPCPMKNMKPFLHKYLRKWTPPAALHRQNAMPHIKTYARFDPSKGNAGTLDWAILTSSNLSKAAWGALQKNKTQLMIRSYELGVMFLPPLLAGENEVSISRIGVIDSKMAQDSTSADDKAAGKKRQSTVLLPLPYQFPIKTFDPKKDEPWIWDVVREEPDVFGNCYIPQ